MLTVYNMAQPSNNFEPYTVGGGKSPTLIARMGTGGNQVPIVHGSDGEISHRIERGNISMDNKLKNWDGTEVAPTLTANNAGGEQRMPDKGNFNAVTDGYAVRRLTPTECERLQGWPDGYTLIENKKCSDSARYKALGNGMAQPCARFVIQRIADAVQSKSVFCSEC